MQDLFSVILRSDRDGDNVISEKEMNQFVLRMKHYAGTRKFGRQQPKFNEQAVREAFSKSLTKTVQSLINVTASMVEDDSSDDEDHNNNRYTSHDEEMGRMKYNTTSSNTNYGKNGSRGHSNDRGGRSGGHHSSSSSRHHHHHGRHRTTKNSSINKDPPGDFEGSSMNPVDVTNFEPPKDDVILDGL